MIAATGNASHAVLQPLQFIQGVWDCFNAVIKLKEFGGSRGLHVVLCENGCKATSFPAEMRNSLLVMKGYYNYDEAKRAMIDGEGWQHTGDNDY